MENLREDYSLMNAGLHFILAAYFMLVLKLCSHLLVPGPPLLFMITVEGPNSLSFSWDAPAPIEGVNPVTNYIVRCTPQLEGIPTPAAVTQGASPPLTAMIDDLASGVLYSCRVAAMNNVGEGIPAEDTATTDETG